MKRWSKALAGLVLFFTSMGMPLAQANTLVATSPIAGSTLKAGPSAITITTEFPLIEEGNEIIVTDPNGKRVDTGILTVLGTDAVAEMKPLETSGVYKVSYLLLSDFDLPLEGSYTFTYSATVLSTPSASAAPQPSASSTAEQKKVLKQRLDDERSGIASCPSLDRTWGMDDECRYISSD